MHCTEVNPSSKYRWVKCVLKEKNMENWNHAMNFATVPVQAWWWHCFMPAWGHMKNQRQAGCFGIKEEKITAKAFAVESYTCITRAAAIT